ncbi:MAG: class I SAM-dependent methyltransferase [Candidatus Hodarchaeota archaeon]
MSKEAMKPFGSALEAYYKGEQDVKVIYHRDDGQITEDFIKGYFRDIQNFPEREKIALGECRGEIIDIGAGAGRHSLELQDRGYDVLAIDISDKACEVMRKRGVKKVKCNTPYEIDDTNFDTILLMGCSIAFVGDLTGLKTFLNHAKSLLNPNGLILMDSRDVRVTDNPKHLEYQKKNIRAGKYRGEINICIEFKGVKGEMFRILHVDPDTLKRIAEENGWDCKVLYKGVEGLYLAKLTQLIQN